MRQLSELRIRSVLPVQRKQHRTGGVNQDYNKTEYYPFPSGYLFVCMDRPFDSVTLPWYRVMNLPNVFGVMPWILPPQKRAEVVEPYIRNREHKRYGLEEVIFLPKKTREAMLKFKPGDVVKILSGPFADFEAAVKASEEGVIKTRVFMFGREVKTTVSDEDVKLVRRGAA